MGKASRSPIELEQLFTPFDKALGELRRRIFDRHRLAALVVSIAAYATAVLALGSRLGVSTNFFILLPIISASIGYGLAMGIAAGALGLPANLALFAILGHPEYSPASKLIAEASGIIVGLALGYLSDYNKKLDAERALRKEMELELRKALDDRETLFKEVHHRVKNNLNLIKSIIGLQARRSADTAFKEAAATLTGRLMSISFVHERLYRTAELSSIAIDEYLRDLVGAIAMAASGSRSPPETELDLQRRFVTMDVAVPLGLIVNELATNALKHGGQKDAPARLHISLRAEENLVTLSVRDDGAGFPGLEGGLPLRIEDAAISTSSKLGFTLLDLMVAQLGGEGYFIRDGGWTELRLTFLDA